MLNKYFYLKLNDSREQINLCGFKSPLDVRVYNALAGMPHLQPVLKEANDLLPTMGFNQQFPPPCWNGSHTQMLHAELRVNRTEQRDADDCKMAELVSKLIKFLAQQKSQLSASSPFTYKLYKSEILMLKRNLIFFIPVSISK